MKIITLAFLLACNIFFLTGCTIKDDDAMSEKIVKHTINTPVYIVIGAGFIASEGSKAALTAILVPPYAAYRYLTEDINNTTDINKTNMNLMPNVEE
ncbi:MAG: hypothetical protein A2525_08160 [Sulfurimonas sp. RIFOXYD12_FULL_36_11]|jgi:hypothetical protein|nr:MAG: hypothetical protein A2525_08160 [Sulfurimonas sp. RIFOXYD12_FULL_36_11]